MEFLKKKKDFERYCFREIDHYFTKKRKEKPGYKK